MKYPSYEQVCETLTATKGNVTEAARLLGMRMQTLRYLAYGKYGIKPGSFKPGKKVVVIQETVEIDSNGGVKDIDWSDAPIAKMYGVWATRYKSMEFNRGKPLEEKS